MTLDEMKSILKKFDNEICSPVTDLNNPNCSFCNECCTGTAFLTDDEFKSLTKYFKTTEGRKILKDAKKRHNKSQEKHNAVSLKCPFSSKNRKCLIYNKRPKICRDFHCKESLCSKDYNKDAYPEEHKVIFHLFDAIGGINK